MNNSNQCSIQINHSFIAELNSSTCHESSHDRWIRIKRTPFKNITPFISKLSVWTDHGNRLINKLFQSRFDLNILLFFEVI